LILLLSHNGDVGLEGFKTGSDYLRAREKAGQGRLGEPSLGFGNLSAIAGIIEQEQQKERRKAAQEQR
jgi:hypothetical protein